MREANEIRLMVFWLDDKVLLTRATTVAEWPIYQRAGWKIFTIDPEDLTAYIYWQEVEGFSLQCLT